MSDPAPLEPRPWTAYTGRVPLYVSAGDPADDDSLPIAEVYDERDAPLIAAAPEMREALEAAEFWLGEELARPGQAKPDEILRVIRAALMKAQPYQGSDQSCTVGE